MSWISGLALIISLVSLVISIINYRKASRRLREVEDTNRKIDAALRASKIGNWGND